MENKFKKIFIKRQVSVIIIILILTIIFLFSFAGNRSNNSEFFVSPLSDNKNLVKNTDEYQNYGFEDSILSNQWTGLGMGLFSTTDDNWNLSSDFNFYVDTLLSNGFNQLRIDIPYYKDNAAVEISKSAVALAVSKGAKVIWGVSSGAGTITDSNWPNFRQSILDAAKWAQDNGVFEFQLGNEEEAHVDEISISKTQIKINIKSVATEVQSIFTRGKISYSCAQESVKEWTVIGKGDIDILALNAYMGGTEFNDNWKTDIRTMVNTFGTDGTYITEFSPSAKSLESYSPDVLIQASAINSMVEYIKSSGITRALSFCFYDDSRPFGPKGFGILKTDKTFRTLKPG